VIDLAAITIGVHLATAHTRSGFEPINPGVYVVADGWTAGALRNSRGVASVYGGYTFETEDRRFALTVGAISGYGGVRPLVVPSVQFDGWRLSLIAKPRGGKRVHDASRPGWDSTKAAIGLHLSYEWRLK